jgi:hypothetical protein
MLAAGTKVSTLPHDFDKSMAAAAVALAALLVIVSLRCVPEL